MKSTNENVKASENKKSSNASKLNDNSSIGMVVGGKPQNQKPCKMKKWVLWLIVSVVTAIVIAGISVGLYFLLKKDNDVPPENEIPPQLNDYVADLNQGNNTSPDIKNEEVVLPEDIEVGEIVFINTEYLVSEKNGVQTIFVRNDSAGNPEAIISFENGSSDVVYDKVLKIKGDVAFIKNTTNNKDYAVSLTNKSVICETTGYQSFEIVNNILFVFDGEDSQGNYPDCLAYELENFSSVLDVEDEFVYDAYLTQSNFMVASDTKTYVYALGVQNGELVLVETIEDYIPREVASDYENANEYVVDMGGKRYVYEAHEEFVHRSSTNRLIAKIVPTKNPTEANSKVTLRGDNGKIDAFLKISYYITDLAGNFVKNIVTPGKLLYAQDESVLDGYEVLYLTEYSVYNENGEIVNNNSKKNYDACLLTNDFSVVFSYNSSLSGNIIYSKNNLFVTSGGGTSGVIGLDGKITDIIDVKKYAVDSPNVYNDMFRVKFSGYYGVSDLDGNVVLTPEILDLSPIIDGYCIGNLNGYFYQIDLNNGTMKFIQNYNSNFHKYVMLGIGMYMTQTDSEYVLYNAKGEALYTFGAYNVVEPNSDDEVLTLILEIENETRVINSAIIDKDFLNYRFDGFSLSGTVNNGEPLKKEYDKLVFSNLLSFSVDNEIGVVTPEEEEDETPSGENSVSNSKDNFVASNTGCGDSSPSYDLVGDTNAILEKYTLGDWTNPDYLKNEQGIVKVVDTVRLEEKIYLTPYVHDFDYVDNSGNHTYNGVVDCAEEYLEYWGTSGYAFGLNYIINCEHGDDCPHASSTTHTYKDYPDSHPLAEFHNPKTLLALMPALDTNTSHRYGETAYDGYSYYDFCIDGVVIIQSSNKDMLVVISRLRVEKDDDLANDSYGWHNGVGYTYHIGIAFAQGYSINQLYVGYYDYWEKFTAENLYPSYNNMQYQRMNRPYDWQLNKLHPTVYYVPSAYSWFDGDYGLLVGAGNEGWGQKITTCDENVVNEVNTNVILRNRNDQILYGRNFFSSIVYEAGFDYSASVNNNTVLRYDFLDNYTNGNNYTFFSRDDYSTTYYNGKSFLYVDIEADLPTIDSWGLLYGYEDTDAKEWIVHDRTYNGMYFTAKISGSTITITPKNGFYVSACTGKSVRIDGWGSVKAGPKDFSVSGVGSTGDVVINASLSGKGSLYIKNFRLVICPIYAHLKVSMYTNHYGENKAMDNSYNTVTLYYPTRVGNYGTGESKIYTETPDVGGSFLRGKDSYCLNTKSMLLSDFKVNKYSNDKDVYANLKGIYNISTNDISSYYTDCAFTTTQTKINDKLIYDSSGTVIDSAYINNNLLYVNKTVDTIYITKYAIALYEAYDNDLELSSGVYDSLGRELVSNAKATGVRVQDTDGNWHSFNINDLSISNFDMSGIKYYDSCSVLKWINHYGEVQKSNYTSGTKTYEYFDLLSKTPNYPSFTYPGYHMPLSDLKFTYMYDFKYVIREGFPPREVEKTDSVSGEIKFKNSKPDTGIDLEPMYDVRFDYLFIFRRLYDDIKPVVKGVYVETKYDFDIDDGDAGGTGGVVFEYPQINGVDTVFDFTEWIEDNRQIGIGDTFTLPVCFAAGYTAGSTTTNATFSWVKKLKGYRTESNEIVDADVSQTLTAETLAKWDKNLDNVIKLTAVWETNPATFKYDISFEDENGDLIALNDLSDYLSEKKCLYNNTTNTTYNIAETALGGLEVSVGVGGALEFKLKMNKNYYISSVFSQLYTGNKRPGVNQGTRSFEYCALTATSLWNNYTNRYYSSYSGKVTEWSTNVSNQYLDGTNSIITEDSVKTRIELSYDDDGYTVFKIKATQIGKITKDYIASAFPGGSLKFKVARKLYDGNVEIKTIRAGKIGYTEKASDLDFIFDYSKFLGAV